MSYLTDMSHVEGTVVQQLTLPTFSGRRGGDMLCRPVAFTVISTLDPAFCLAAALAGMPRRNSASRSNQRSCKRAQRIGMDHGRVNDVLHVNISAAAVMHGPHQSPSQLHSPHGFTISRQLSIGMDDLWLHDRHA